jgi:hypothetical protein
VARKVFTRCSQHENLSRTRWISSVQVQVAEHAILGRDNPHETRPAASDALGRSLDSLNPLLMLWSYGMVQRSRNDGMNLSQEPHQGGTSPSLSIVKQPASRDGQTAQACAEASCHR